MKNIKATIEGISPLLMCRFSEEEEVKKETSRKTKKDYGTPREQARKLAYLDEKTEELWVPSLWIKSSIHSVASDYKLPSSRKSAKSVTGGAIIMVNEKIYFKEKYKFKDSEIDSRPVVIQRARIMRHRPKIEKWTLEFEMEIDDTILDTENINAMLVDAGRRSGIGSYRPQKSGSFGRFIVTHWEICK